MKCKRKNDKSTEWMTEINYRCPSLKRVYWDRNGIGTEETVKCLVVVTQEVRQNLLHHRILLSQYKELLYVNVSCCVSSLTAHIAYHDATSIEHARK